MKDLNDDQFCEVLAAKFQEVPEGHPKMMGDGPFQGRLSDALKEIVKKFRSETGVVPWNKIMALIPQIVLLLSTGGANWSAVLALVLDLFFPKPSPTPTVSPTMPGA